MSHLLKRKYRPGIHKACVYLLCYNLLLTQTFPVLAQQTSISPDGRTGTTVTPNGGVYDVHTSTVHGNNAFNSFSRFDVGNGDTANLHLPGGTQNLLNLVNDSRASTINGIVNSYKNGEIGGNVFFMNPHGFMIGESGVINTGSLSLSTPTQKFMDDLISPQGMINHATTSQFLSGEFPISPSGLISVRGKINVKDKVELVGNSVHVGSIGQIRVTPEFRIPYSEIVNTQGIDPAVGVEKLADGTIRILGAEDVRIAGKLNADGIQAGNHGGNIDIQTVRGDIVVATGADITADGTGTNGDGGKVVIFAGHDATLEQGAKVSARGNGTGDGGFIEFSARQAVSLLGTNLDASSEQGAGGTVLIDPQNIIIDQDVFTNGAEWKLEADNLVQLNGVFVSTRKIDGAGDRELHRTADSIGNSGKVIIDAQHIELNNSEIVTCVIGDNAFTAGNIELQASRKSTALLDYRDGYRTGIVLNGSLLDAGVYRDSTARAAWTLDNAQGFRAGDVLLQAVDGNAISGIDFYAEKSARIKVDDTSVLIGRDVTLEAASASGFNLDKSTLSEMLGLTLDSAIVARLDQLQAELDNLDKNASDYSDEVTRIRGEMKFLNQQLHADLIHQQNSSDKFNAWQQDGIDFLESQFESLLTSTPIVGVKVNSAKSVIDFSGKILATNDVKIASRADSGATISVLGYAGALSFAKIKGESLLSINSTAQIDAFKDVTIQSDVSSKGKLDSSENQSSSFPFDIAFALLMSDSTNRLNVLEAATITAGGNIDIFGKTTRETEISASAGGEKDLAAITFAMARERSETSVLVDGNLHAGENIDISAATIVDENSVSSKSRMGDQFFPDYVAPSVDPSEQAKNALTTFISKKADKMLEGKLNLGNLAQYLNLAGAVAVIDDTWQTGAVVGPNATIRAGNDFSLSAKTEGAFYAGGIAIIGTEKEGENDAKFAIGVGLPVILIDQSTKAQILGTTAQGANIHVGGNVHVAANTSYVYDPISQHPLLNLIFGTTLGETEVDTAFDVQELLDELLGSADDTGWFGVNDGLFSSWSQATSEATHLAVAGAATFMKIENTTIAQVADGVKIRGYDGGETHAGNMSVEAKTLLENVNFSGPIRSLFGALDWSKGEDSDKRNIRIQTLWGTEDAPVGIGASFLGLFNENTTIARIDAASVNVADLSVVADTRVLQVAISAGGGVAKSFGLNGMASVTEYDGYTLAKIDDAARIRANDVAIDAVDRMVNVNVALGITKSEKAGIGVGVGVGLMQRDVYALWGNLLDKNGNLATIRGDAAVETLAADTVTSHLTGDLRINAKATGFNGVYAVSGTLLGDVEDDSSNNPQGNTNVPDGPVTPNMPIQQGQVTADLKGSGGFIGQLQQAVSAIQDGMGIQNATKNTAAGQNEQQDSSFSLAISADAAVNMIEENVVALLGGNLKLEIDNNKNAAVSARNSTLANSVSGSAVLSMAGQDSGGSGGGGGGGGGVEVGFAGSYAHTVLDGRTQTHVSPLGGLWMDGKLDATAHREGDLIAIAAGFAVKTSQGQGGTTIQLAGSGSFADIGDITQVLITDTSIKPLHATAAPTNDIVAVALANARIINIAGGINFGASIGVGGSVAIGLIDQNTGVIVKHAEIVADSAALYAVDGSGIISVALAGSIATGDDAKLAAAGSAAYNSVNTETVVTIDSSQMILADSLDAKSASISNFARDFGRFTDLLPGGSDLKDDDENSIKVDSGDLAAQRQNDNYKITSTYFSENGADLSLIGNKADDIKIAVLEENGDQISLNENGTPTQTETLASHTGELAAKDNLNLNIGGNESTTPVKPVALSTNIAALNRAIDNMKDTSAPKIISAGVAFGGGGKVALGGNLGVSVVADKTAVEVIDSLIVANKGIDALGMSTGGILSVGIGASGSNTFAGASAMGLNMTSKTTGVLIDNSNLTAINNDVNLNAVNSARMITVTGAVSGSDSAALQGTVAYNQLVNRTLVDVSDSTIEAAMGSINMKSLSKGDIIAVNVAGGGSSSVALSGTAAINTIGAFDFWTNQNSSATEKLDAATYGSTKGEGLLIDGGMGTVEIGGILKHFNVIKDIWNTDFETGVQATNSSLMAGQSINLRADMSGRVITVAAAASGSGTFVGGGAGSYANIADVTKILLKDSSATAQTGYFSAIASDDAEIISVAAGLGGSGTVALEGSLGITSLTSTLATVAENTHIFAGLDATLKSERDADVITVVGSVAGSGTVAMAGGAAVNVQSMNILSQVKRGSIRANDLNVETVSDGLLVSVAAAGSGSGAVTLAGTTAINFLLGKTESAVTHGADVLVDNNISVTADSSQNLWTVTPVVHFGLYFSADTSLVLALQEDYTRAVIENSDVSAWGDILVDAKSERNHHAISVQAGGGLVAASAPFNLLFSGTTTESLVKNSRINRHDGISGVGFSGNLKVNAESAVDEWDLLIAIGGGGAAAAVSGNLVTMDTLTQSLVSGSDVYARDVNISATSDETIWMSAVTIAGGGGVAAGGFTMPILSGKTFAGIDSLTVNSNPSKIEVLNDLVIKARADSEFNTIQAQAAVGSSSLSGLFTVTFDDRQISSFIGNGATITAGRDVLVESISNRTYLTGEGNLSGLFAMFAVQGTVNLNNIASQTISQIGDDVSINAKRNITVSALDDTDIRNYLFGAAASNTGISLVAGVVIDLVNLNGTVQSNIGRNSTLIAETGDITITADSDRFFKMIEVSASLSWGYAGAFTVSLLQSRSDTATRYVLEGEDGKTEDIFIAGAKNQNERSKDYLEFLTEVNGLLQDKTHAAVDTILDGLGIKNIDTGKQEVAIASSTNAPSTAGVSVGTGTLLKSGNDITLDATAKTDLKMIIGSGSIGAMGASLAGSASLVNLEDISEVTFNGKAEAGGNVAITAQSLLGTSSNAADITTVAGSAGYLSIAGAIQIVNSNGVSSVKFGKDAQVSANANIDVQSVIDRYFKTETVGTSVGLLTLGGVYSLLNDNSTSRIIGGDSFLASSRAGNISMTASNHNAMRQNLKSFGVGGVALAGAVNNTWVNGTSSVEFGDDVSLLAKQGKITIASLIDPEYSIDAIGASGSILLSLAGVYVKLDADTTSKITGGDRLTLEANEMIVQAIANESDKTNFDLAAFAGGYSLLASLSGVLVQDDLKSATIIDIGDGFAARSLDQNGRLTGSLTMLSDNRIRKVSDSVGSTAAGAAAVSLAFIDSKTKSDSRIAIGGDANIAANVVNMKAINSTHYRNILVGEANAILAGVTKWNKLTTEDVVTTTLQFNDNILTPTAPNVRANSLNLLAENASSRISFLSAQAGAWFVTNAAVEEKSTYDYRTGTLIGNKVSLQAPFMTIAANNDVSLNWDRDDHDFAFPLPGWNRIGYSNRQNLTYGYADSSSDGNGGLTSDSETDIFKSLTFTHLDAKVDIGENAVLSTGQSGYDMETMDISTLNRLTSYQRSHMDGKNSVNLDSKSYIHLDVQSAESQIRVGKNASLFSAKDMVLENSTQFTLFHEIEAFLEHSINDNDVHQADNFVKLLPEQSITIEEGANLVSLDNIRLAAGANDASSILINLISVAGSAFYAKNNQRYAVQFELDNQITVDAGALVFANRNVDLLTKPSDKITRSLPFPFFNKETIRGFTVRNKDGFALNGWHDASQTVPRGTGFYDTPDIVNTFSSPKRTASPSGKNDAKRFADIYSYGTVNVNGTVEAGFGGTQQIHFDRDGNRVIYDRDGNIYCFETATRDSNGQRVVSYFDLSGQPFTPDWSRVVGGDLAWHFDPAQNGPNGTIVLPDITSRGGTINITADQLYSSQDSGQLLAHGPSPVDIQNAAFAFLSAGNIIIPTGDIGGVTYNGVLLPGNTQDANAKITSMNATTRYLPFGGSVVLEDDVIILVPEADRYLTLQSVIDANIQRDLMAALKHNYEGYFADENDMLFAAFNPDTFPLNYALKNSDLYDSPPTDPDDPFYDPRYLGDNRELIFHKQLFRGNWKTETVTTTVDASPDITSRAFMGLVRTRVDQLPANFRNIISKDVDGLTVSVANKNADAYNPSQLILRGNIRNPWGDVTIRSVGDITQLGGGSVYGRTIFISTSGNFTQQSGSSWMGYLNDIPSNLVAYLNDNPNATDAEAFLNSLTPGKLVAGGFVRIEADKININGMIQSGAALYEINVTSEVVKNAIEQYRTDYANGTALRELDLYPLLLADNPELPPLRIIFDGATDRIWVDDIVTSAQSGIELSGNVFSTGKGSLNVFDGYAEVILNNETDYALEMNLVDVSAKMDGTIRIIDKSRTQNGNSLVTEYRSVDDGSGTLLTQYREQYGAFGDPEAGWLDFTSGEYATKADRYYQVRIDTSAGDWSIFETLTELFPGSTIAKNSESEYFGQFDASRVIGINFLTGADAPKIALSSINDVLLNGDLLTAPKGYGPNHRGGEISVTSTAGAIMQNVGTTVVAGYAPISLFSDKDITLTSLVTSGVARSDGSALVQVVSSGGAIGHHGTDDSYWTIHGNTHPLNIEAANAKVLLKSASGIGQSGAITGDVDELELAVTGSGNIQFVERGGMNRLDADAADGHVSLHSTGSTKLGNLSARSTGTQKHDLFFSAEGDIDLIGNSLNASGNVYLVADGWGNRGMLTSAGPSPVRISGDNIYLAATKSIGTTADYLNVTLSGTANIYGRETVYLRQSGGSPLMIGLAMAQNELHFDAPGTNIEIDRLISSRPFIDNPRNLTGLRIRELPTEATYAHIPYPMFDQLSPEYNPETQKGFTAFMKIYDYPQPFKQSYLNYWRKLYYDPTPIYRDKHFCPICGCDCIARQGLPNDEREFADDQQTPSIILEAEEHECPVCGHHCPIQ